MLDSRSCLGRQAQKLTRPQPRQSKLKGGQLRNAVRHQAVPRLMGGADPENGSGGLECHDLSVRSAPSKTKVDRCDVDRWDHADCRQLVPKWREGTVPRVSSLHRSILKWRSAVSPSHMP